MDRLFVKSKSRAKKNQIPTATEYFPRNGGSGSSSVPSSGANLVSDSVASLATSSTAGSTPGSTVGSTAGSSGSLTGFATGSVPSLVASPAAEKTGMSGPSIIEKFPIYEPAEVMNETDFTVPEDDSLRSDIQRAIRRVAIRNKSDTDSLIDGGIRMETVSDTSEPVVDKRIDAGQYYKNYPYHTGIDMTTARGVSASSSSLVTNRGTSPTKPSSNSDSSPRPSANAETTAEPQKNSEPVTMTDSSIVINKNDIIASIVKCIRELSRRSFILLPVDNIISNYPQSQPAVLAVETFCLMITANILAQIVQMVCKPAVWLLHLVLYFFT